MYQQVVAPSPCPKVQAILGNPGAQIHSRRFTRAQSSPEVPQGSPGEQPDPPGHAPATESSAAGPSLQEGITWYCYLVIGLITVTDLTPIGYIVKLLSSSSSSTLDVPAGAAVSSSQPGSSSLTALLLLAGLQWLLFVVPSLLSFRSKGWGLGPLLGLTRPAQGGWLLAAPAAGAALWLLLRVAVAAKSGVPPWQVLDPGTLPGGLGPEAGAPPGLDATVLGGVVQVPEGVGQWMQLLAGAALSPAVAEELLFRGFLLTALRSSLGRVDAVLLAAALFAASHLDMQQFFALTVMGAAAGALTLSQGSVLPAMGLHAGYNLAGLAAGALLGAGAR
eukprot:CAMPEP_0202905052 /NCGR_PEP_ID=MMETSP1392-20130828/32273_1 /ASSEMBLY_ACC=CAM_ASM_000868 /TAXON_ID=225041 /ORGANISM="Chlamydomonas chlamydogama, Strain SAG 11-48b" /LENGTH=333 /DNA_ID=CAMNT_0049592973 /DNA_START=75 /DNA_END=1080 /DNA_ORIENTATION=+